MKWLERMLGKDDAPVDRVRREVLVGGLALATDIALSSVPFSEALAAESQAGALHAAANNREIVDALRKGSSEVVLKTLEKVPSIHNVLGASPEDQRALLGLVRPPMASNALNPNAWPTVGVASYLKQQAPSAEKLSAHMNGVPVVIKGDARLITPHSWTAKTIAGNFEGLDNFASRGFNAELQPRVLERAGKKTPFADVVPVTKKMIVQTNLPQMPVSVVGYTMGGDKKWWPRAHAGVAWKLSEYRPLANLLANGFIEEQEKKARARDSKERDTSKAQDIVRKYFLNCWALKLDTPEGDITPGLQYPEEVSDGATVIVNDPMFVPRGAPYGFFGMKSQTIIVEGEVFLLIHGPEIMEKLGID